MSEKSWASLAPLLDNRRYVESIIAGIKIHAHRDFRMCATMNDDASTFELPEYIHSRLQPQIMVDFPERDEEKAILAENLPFADDEVLDYVTDFLQAAHVADERYTARDGINIGRFALKLQSAGMVRHGTRAFTPPFCRPWGKRRFAMSRQVNWVISAGARSNICRSSQDGLSLPATSVNRSWPTSHGTSPSTSR